MSSFIIKLVIAVLVCNFEVISYEIVGLFASQAASHFRVFHPIMEELARKGHNVTVFTYARTKNRNTTYKEIAVSNENLVEGVTTFDRSRMNLVTRQLFEMEFLCQLGLEACEALLKNDEAKSILAGIKRFDVIISEQFNSDCAFVFLDKLRVPFIAVTSDTLYPHMYERAGVPNNPSYTPFRSLPYGRHPNFIQRVVNTVSMIYNNIRYTMKQRKTESLIKLHVKEFPSLETLTKNISLFLINSHPTLYGADALPPNVINVGGVHTHNQRKPLPNDINDFINGATHGVIYLCFGSMIRASSMPKDKLNEFVSALAELPHRVLWKWENEDLPGAPSNVLIKKSLPQLDILSHKNVKLFISHGGMLGIIEAMDTGVPVLTIPLYGDQFANAAAIQERGLGMTLQFNDITKESLLKAMKYLLDPKVYANAKRLSRMWHDRPMSPLDTAIYWIEYVARHGGAPHLRSAAVDLPLYQYLLLDVVALLAVIGLIILCINYLILKIMLRLFFRVKNTSISGSNTCENKKIKND